LYNLVIIYIANINIFTSLRELQREIEKIENISLKTLIDYIDFSIKSKIIKQVYQYDIKKDKIISSKSKYYFTDT
jgi:predicted AAA+ superfamily ATPase